jgi:acyl dehydratase
MEIQSIKISELTENQILDFGEVVLGDNDIIQYSLTHDPIPFHIDKEFAEKSHFKGLIASGPHLFHIFYTREWIPRFKNTVYAGRGVTNWMMERPVYANATSYCKCHVKKIDPKPERGFNVIHWYFEFTNEKNELLQALDLIVLHYLEI